MRARVFSIAMLLAVGCTQRAPAAPTWSDLDASPPEGGLTPIAPRGGAPRPGSPRDPDAGGGPTVEGCHARLLVVFDRSGSMADPWPGADPEAPRWRVAADALAVALEPIADRLEVGAILFPSGVEAEPGLCAPVAPIEAQLSWRSGVSFLAAWDAYWSTPTVGGSTPIDEAFARADEALPRDDVVTAVVLLSDGQPTCANPISAVDYADAWWGEGASTYVIGLPGLLEAGVLDAIAAAGGTGGHLSVGASEVLTNELALIAGDAIDQACAHR